MALSPTTFETPHNEAFLKLGALAPGQHWSAFDVPRGQAKAGRAKLFVTTIWNYHSKKEQGRRTPTELAIGKDKTDGTFWNRVPKPEGSDARRTWTAHWNGLALALSEDIPVVGVLKDVNSGLCSLKNIFDCPRAIPEADGSAIWLQIKPRDVIGCEVNIIDIHQATGQQRAIETIDVVILFPIKISNN